MCFFGGRGLICVPVLADLCLCSVHVFVCLLAWFSFSFSFIFRQCCHISFLKPDELYELAARLSNGCAYGFLVSLINW